MLAISAFAILFGVFIIGCIFAIVRQVIAKCKKSVPAPPAVVVEPAQPVDENMKWKLDAEEEYKNLLLKCKMHKGAKASFDLTECAIC